MPTYLGMPTETARAYQDGAADAYGHAPERAVSDGVGVPCRHCLRNVPAGEEMLILAHRPFDALQPYAETGPIFLCAAHCPAPDGALPPVLKTSPEYLLKGYDDRQRIVYGTGAIVAQEGIADYAIGLLDRPGIAFVDVRSARNNCWQVRITR